MLVLTRKTGEQIRISTDIVLTIKRIKGGRVSIGIAAPDPMLVLRGELRNSPPIANPHATGGRTLAGARDQHALVGSYQPATEPSACRGPSGAPQYEPQHC